MIDKISKQELQSVLGMSAEKRYDYFVEKITHWEAIWILRDKKGCVMVSSDGQDCIPVWPHQDYAGEWATGEWSECKPESISLDRWLERWIPGMEHDGIEVAVFPNAAEEGVVVHPEELNESILCEIDNYDEV